MVETELYGPVKELLEEQGFEVKAEVRNIDIFAIKDSSSVAVELKSQMSLKLIYQAIERQKIADFVYIAIPLSAWKSHKKGNRSFPLLLKRLSIGLIVADENQATVQIEPVAFDMMRSKKQNSKEKNRVMKEYLQRSNSLNIGGSRGKRFTAYKEKVMKVAQVLYEVKMASPKGIKVLCEIKETASILQKNYYGWFVRIERGQYSLTEIGLKEFSVLKNQGLV